MKTISNALVICAILFVGILHAEGAPENPTNPAQYPMIEKHAPEKIKEFCNNEQSCSECDIVERILWCAEKKERTYKMTYDSAGNPKSTPDALDINQYCNSCFEDTRSFHGQKTMHVIDSIARETNLSHDEAFALLKEFNSAVSSLERASRLKPRES